MQEVSSLNNLLVLLASVFGGALWGLGFALGVAGALKLLRVKFSFVK